jgi:serine/threonine-protein phosphatase CPPED1
MKKIQFGILAGIMLFMVGCSAVNEVETPNAFGLRGDNPPDMLATKAYDFAVLGDNRPDSRSLEYFFKMISQLNIPTVYHVGDLVEFASPLYFVSIMEALDCCFSGEFNATVGNHDVNGASGNSLKNLEIFNYFFKISAPLNYRYEEKPKLHYISLNSFLPDQENRLDDTQMAWLSDTLESIPDDGKPIFVFLHHPPYPAGAHPPLFNRDALHNVLKDYPVKAVFAGHEHLYYKEVVDGIPYYVTGGAGSELHEAPKGNPIHHFLAVSLVPTFQVDVIDTNGHIIE